MFSPFDKSTTTVSSSTAAGFAPSSPPSEEKDFVADVEIHFLVLLPRLANEEVEEEDFVNEDDDARSRWRPFSPQQRRPIEIRFEKKRKKRNRERKALSMMQ